jgi:2-isopropylmalate synthase
MLSAIKNTVSACKNLCDDVEFVAGDATRSDASFLEAAVKTAIEAGASTVTFCDTAGVMLPEEFSSFLEGIFDSIPELCNICVGVSCSDALSMADSCAVSAVRCGASEIKATAVATDNVRLGKIAKILDAKGGTFDVCGKVRMAEINRVLSQIDRLCHTEKSKNSPFDDSVREEGEWVLTEHDDISAVLKAAERLGYELSEDDGVKVFEAFKQIAMLKKKVGSKELDAIVASSALQVPPTYKLESYVINSGNQIKATANIRMRKDDEVLQAVCMGDGPIDAAFLAIEQIAGQHYELDDFQINSVTQGQEAMGETVVKLIWESKVYPGRGISTDIIGSSIRAYVNALNKIVYEEQN